MPRKQKAHFEYYRIIANMSVVQDSSLIIDTESEEIVDNKKPITRNKSFSYPAIVRKNRR